MKKSLFIQKIFPYKSELLVLVGITDKKVVYRYLKKTKLNFQFSKWVLSNFDNCKRIMENKGFSGFFSFYGNFRILILPPFRNNWDYWETLIHETHHIVQNIAEQKMFLNEPENQAYLQDFLFRSIREKLFEL